MFTGVPVRQGVADHLLGSMNRPLHPPAVLVATWVATALSTEGRRVVESDRLVDHTQ